MPSSHPFSTAFPRLGAGLLLAAGLLATAGPLPAPLHAQDAPAERSPAARNLILLVTDGGGASHWALARRARGHDLAVASMPVAGLVDTQNSEGGITDSAAGATAYATGRRSFNRGIAMTPGCVRDGEGETCEPMETLLEAAEARGKATGLITTTGVVDATPASFAAHVRSRYDFVEIANQMVSSGVDVLLGGGRAAFDGSSGEASNILARVCPEADCPSTVEELRALPPSDRRLIGLLGQGELPPVTQRDFGLAELTETALDRLAMNPEGFFLLVENEGTDSYSHDNLDAGAITAEIVDLDRAVETALAFARTHPGTLVVVTADHETGGLSVYREQGEIVVRYSSGNHTDALVPLFAEGPGAEQLGGLRDNEEVGRILWRLFIGRGPGTD